MKKVITEKGLRNIIKSCINEAMHYDKERKQYFPNYTGNPHSDAGKFVDYNRGDFNYSRNDYQWSDPEKQDRFNSLQWQNDFEVHPCDPDKENQDNAESYLEDHETYNIIKKASQEMSGEFTEMIQNFFDKAAKQYPILKDRYYMMNFYHNIREIFDEYKYEIW